MKTALIYPPISEQDNMMDQLHDGLQREIKKAKEISDEVGLSLIYVDCRYHAPYYQTLRMKQSTA